VCGKAARTAVYDASHVHGVGSQQQRRREEAEGCSRVVHVEHLRQRVESAAAGQHALQRHGALVQRTKKLRS
jgi:hypothetical protein